MLGTHSWVRCVRLLLRVQEGGGRRGARGTLWPVRMRLRVALIVDSVQPSWFYLGDDWLFVDTPSWVRSLTGIGR